MNNVYDFDLSNAGLCEHVGTPERDVPATADSTTNEFWDNPANQTNGIPLEHEKDILQNLT